MTQKNILDVAPKVRQSLMKEPNCDSGTCTNRVLHNSLSKLKRTLRTASPPFRVTSWPKQLELQRHGWCVTLRQRLRAYRRQGGFARIAISTLDAYHPTHIPSMMMIYIYIYMYSVSLKQHAFRPKFCW